MHSSENEECCLRTDDHRLGAPTNCSHSHDDTIVHDVQVSRRQIKTRNLTNMRPGWYSSEDLKVSINSQSATTTNLSLNLQYSELTDQKVLLAFSLSLISQ